MATPHDSLISSSEPNVDRIVAELRAKDRQVRIEHAVATVAASLLAEDGDLAPVGALDALLEATDADFVFLDRNVDDGGDLGFVNVAHRARPGSVVPEQVNRAFSKVSWAHLPFSRAQLEQGKPVAFRVDELEGPERDFYTNVVQTSASSVVKLPVRRGHRWMGVVGFAHVEPGHRWSPEDLHLLGTAAGLIATFWERREFDEARSASLAAMARRIEMEHALAEAARMLLLGEGEDSVRKALEALRRASGSSYAFVNTCEEDPEAGPVLCSHVAVAAPGLEALPADREYWRRVPWATLPTSYEHMRQGLPFAFTIDQLEGRERDWYDNAPTRIKSEVKIPIFAEGELVGIIGFSDVERARRWNREDLLVLGTAARMVAVFWERVEARQTLESLVRSKDEFVAAVSHELRTPLTAVVGLAQELRSGLERFTPDETEEFVGLIADQATEVAHIVEDLLVVARSDIGRVRVVPEPVRVRPEVERVLAAALPQRPVPVSGPDGTVVVDPARFRQILRNLITNAVRYGGDRVEVHIQGRHGGMAIEVRDDGEGVPPAEREHIFEPYQTAHRRVGQPASVGLGLTVSRQLARLMGGELLYRREEPWSIFELTLPS